jgi:hypothetical protein
VNNKYKFTVPGTNQSITIPIEMQWDFLGRDDSIDVYQEDVLKIVAGLPEDFEVIRFAHDTYGLSGKTILNYQFYFYSGVPANVTASTISDWTNSYLSEGFTIDDLYYKTKPFKKSFFKLDFYDTTDSVNQVNCFTIILPSYNGTFVPTNISPTLINVNLNKPEFLLDYITSPGLKTTKDGFFIYWLKSKTFIDLDTFYMSVKFFDAKQGVYVRMMTSPQSSLPNKFVFDNDNYFYLKVKLDYNTKTYEIYDSLNVRIGIGTPIKWYEYVNP